MSLGWCCRTCDVKDIRDPKNAPHMCGSAHDQSQFALRVIKLYNEAADKFIAKVERGEARSRETYADLKRARDLAKELE